MGYSVWDARASNRTNGLRCTFCAICTIYTICTSELFATRDYAQRQIWHILIPRSECNGPHPQRDLDCFIVLKVSDLATLPGNHNEHTVGSYDSLTGSNQLDFINIIRTRAHSLKVSMNSWSDNQDMILLDPIEGNGSNGSKFA